MNFHFSRMLLLFVPLLAILPVRAAEPGGPAEAPQVQAPQPRLPEDEAAPLPEQRAPAQASPTGGRKMDYAGKVVVIPVGEEDLINPARFAFMSRTLKRAEDEGAEAVIFDMDTPGGIAWNTTTVMMEDLQKLQVRSVSFVNPRALSAGALIALGTDVIYMSPASSIGAATPVMSSGAEMGDAERAKMNSAMMAMARSAAKAKGHRADVADAMIDKDVGLKIGEEEIVAKGQICTLDQEQATKLYDGRPLLAKGVARDLADLKRQEGFQGETVTAEPLGFELMAIYITKYAAILLLVGLAGGYLEMQQPGFGLPGILSATAFAIFFFGHFVAGSLVGYEAVAVFVLGVVLIAVELFVLPGMIIPGAVGLVMVLGSLLYAMASWDITVPEGGWLPVSFDAYAWPLMNLGLAFAGAILLVLIAMRYLPSVGPFKSFVLETEVEGEQDSIEGESRENASHVLVGATGLTRSAMRPHGTVTIGDTTVEAMVTGDLLAPNTPVRVRSVTGGRVVVEKLE